MEPQRVSNWQSGDKETGNNHARWHWRVWTPVPMIDCHRCWRVFPSLRIIICERCSISQTHPWEFSRRVTGPWGICAFVKGIRNHTIQGSASLQAVHPWPIVAMSFSDRVDVCRIVPVILGLRWNLIDLKFGVHHTPPGNIHSPIVGSKTHDGDLVLTHPNPHCRNLRYPYQFLSPSLNGV